MLATSAMNNRTISGVHALAEGAISAGVSLVTGYPGAPATGVVDKILSLSQPDAVRIEWTSNEKVALEVAFGASLGGQRALFCAKSVGLNIALDPLMVINLSGCNAGLVLLVGDDPGSWGSQNEQDSRPLGIAAEIPVLEPTTVPDAGAAIRSAFELSEQIRLPVIVLFTSALATGRAQVEPPAQGSAVTPPDYIREFMKWVVLPVNAVQLHGRLHDRLARVQAGFETSQLNGSLGSGRRRIVAAGYAFQKLMDVVSELPAGLAVFRLGTIFPLPVSRSLDQTSSDSGLLPFVVGSDSVLVLEEGSPLVERALCAALQAAKISSTVCGQDTGHVPQTGELFGPEIAAAVNCWWPEAALTASGAVGRPRPSRQPFCEGCSYIPAFDALLSVMQADRGRDAYIVVGEPGCMVRSQLPPYELMDVKLSLGASIGMATGLALTNRRERVIAITGDSAFLHTGVNGLMDAARIGTQLTVLILDNLTTALSGGQPHPASPVDARGCQRRPLELAQIARAAGAAEVQVVDLDRGEQMEEPIRQALRSQGVSVVIARGRCPRWSPGS
jgi:indolepyruvate ferredoxin oxidoreductase alpha subunit